MENNLKRITAVLGPTNTGKTHLAVETMLEYESGIIGFPLRLLAREIFDKCRKKIGEEIEYGRFATITSISGISNFRMSASTISAWSANFCLRTTANHLSFSTAKRSDFVTNLSVKIPLPGPISRTFSPDAIDASETIRAAIF